MALKEILNNIIKHADAKSVSVDFSMDDNPEGRKGSRKLIHTVTFRISDDGKGFDPQNV